MQLVLERVVGDSAVTARSLLTGDALTAWIIADDTSSEPAMRRARVRLSRLGMLLCAVQSDGSLLSEH